MSTDVESTGPPRAGGPVRPVLAPLTGLLVAVPLALIVPALILGGQGGASSHPMTLPTPNPADPYPRLLLALPVVLVACYLAGKLFRRLGQPPVIGEICAGVALGPSLLGAVWPAAFGWLFPSHVVPAINTLAQLGLIFFVFLVGYEVDLAVVRPRGYTTATVSQVNIVVGMLSGILLAFGLYPAFGGDVGFPAFALFLAVSMSVTAFPVLARILRDRGIADTPLGSLALSCAAIGDVVAWCLLAVVVAISGRDGLGPVALTLTLTVAFIAAMLLVGRPLLARLLAKADDQATLSIMLSGIMLCALATDEIGIHPIFGAFLFGAIAPRGSASIGKATGWMGGVTMALLLPLFFVYTGLHTAFGLLAGGGALWAWCGLITLTAMAGIMTLVCTVATSPMLSLSARFRSTTTDRSVT